jgi:hypothetical protein
MFELQAREIRKKKASLFLRPPSPLGMLGASRPEKAFRMGSTKRRQTPSFVRKGAVQNTTEDVTQNPFRGFS